MPTLGEELKRLREEKGLSLRQVSDATHIGTRFLQAIEADNYSILPGGIFNRGFVRSFARSVGLDEEQALVLYNQQLEVQGGETPRVNAPSLEGIEEDTSSPWGSIALIVIILLLLSAGIYTAYRWFKGSAVAQDIVNVTRSTPTPLPTPTPETTESQAAVSPSPSASPGESPSASPSPSPSVPSSLQVRIQVTNNQCWLKVTTDANKPVEGTLNTGDVREFSANEKMILSVGNAVDISATLNGRPMKLPLKKGVSSYVVLTKANFQEFLQ